MPLTTDQMRAAMALGMPDELAATLDRDEPVWDTAALRAEFEVLGFAAPMVVVRRKSDGRRGTLMFTHHPRFYFGFQEA